MHMPSWLWSAALVTGLGAAAWAHVQEKSLKTDLPREHDQLGEKVHEVSRYEEAVQEFEHFYGSTPRPGKHRSAGARLGYATSGCSPD